MPTIETSIKVIEISSYLSANAVANGSLFNKKINPKHPIILYLIAKVLRKIFTLDPNFPSLQRCADYGYYLSSPFNLTALGILNNGGNGVVVGGTSASSNTYWVIRIFSNNFSDATHYENPDIVGHPLLIFDNNNQKFLNRIDESPDWGYTDTGIVFYNIDTTTGSYDFEIWVKGGAASGTTTTNQPLIININNESSKTISWTSTLQARFGVFPDLELWLYDTESARYQLSSIQPTIDQPPPNMTLIAYEFGGDVTGFITVK